MKNTSLLLRAGSLLGLSVLLVPSSMSAAEIQHHSITAVRGDTALVLSHTPSGDTEFQCSLTDGSCEEEDTDESLFPTILGREPSETSLLGRYGVTQQSLALGAAPITFYSFYDLTSSDAPKFAGLVSVSGTISKTAFSPDERAYVMVKNDGTVVVYDIEERTQRTIMLDQKDLPFFSVSTRGTYVAAYNYVTETHKIWNTKTGALIAVPGTPSTVEFNENETEAAYAVLDDGYKNLRAVTLDGSREVTEAAHGDYLVEDYVYLDGVLYYLANKVDALTWALYNAETGERVAENISYNTFLTRYDDRIVYGKIDEKNIDLYTFNGTEHTRISAAPVSERVAELTREDTTFGGRSAAVIMPEDIDDGDLYIWLHGGPQRQTSIDYHPYLSYAVYDELLENIAAAGNYIVKLDYTGSWGYGDDFINALHDNVGTIEIEDIANTIEEFKEEHEVNNVHLIGNSYGGYMAMRGLNALHDEIDGIISINGVADWYTLVQTIPSSPFRDLFGGVPSLATLDSYLAASAFTNTDEIDDQKMLVVYGNEDKTVPTAQSKQYFEFMDANDKNVELVELEGAEHAITRRENLDELCLAIKETFVSSLACRD